MRNRDKKRRRKHVVLAAASVLAAVLMAGSAHLGMARRATGALGRAEPPAPAQKGRVIVNGAERPDLIPDHAAYAMIFRVIADRGEEAQRRSIRSYINQLGLGSEACRNCPDGARRGDDGGADPEVESLIGAAEHYHREVTLLDQQAKAIKDATWQNPTPEARAALADLQRRKIELVNSVVASLDGQLGADASARLRRAVNERVKRLTKLSVGRGNGR